LEIADRGPHPGRPCRCFRCICGARAPKSAGSEAASVTPGAASRPARRLSRAPFAGSANPLPRSVPAASIFGREQCVALAVRRAQDQVQRRLAQRDAPPNRVLPWRRLDLSARGRCSPVASPDRHPMLHSCGTETQAELKVPRTVVPESRQRFSMPYLSLRTHHRSLHAHPQQASGLDRSRTPWTNILVAVKL
jgi:hypothetical protein